MKDLSFQVKLGIPTSDTWLYLKSAIICRVRLWLSIFSIHYIRQIADRHCTQRWHIPGLLVLHTNHAGWLQLICSHAPCSTAKVLIIPVALLHPCSTISTLSTPSGRGFAAQPGLGCKAIGQSLQTQHPWGNGSRVATVDFFFPLGFRMKQSKGIGEEEWAGRSRGIHSIWRVYKK